MAPRLNKNLILQHFDISNDNISVVCKICKHLLQKDRTYNLKTHLRKIHQLSMKEIENCSSYDSVIVETKSTRRKKIKIEMSRKKFFRSYIGLVIEDGIPFNVLNSENMRNIINPICHTLSENLKKNFCLNSTNCKSVLKLVADNIKENIKTELHQRLISLKLDSATRLSRNLFVLSAQFIKNNEITSTILGMVELKEVAPNSSRNMATEIINLLSKYNVNLNQVVSITSDSGASMIKTTTILSHCSSFNEFYEENEVEEANDVYLKNIELFEYTSDIQFGDIQICRCAAHTAQLCALDVTKNPNIKTYLMNCRNLVKFIKKNSNDYSQIFELRNLALPQLDCPTRWGSTYNMIEKVYAAKEILGNVESVQNKSLDENFKLTDDFWDFVNSYCTVFEPLQRTIMKFQEEHLHYGNFFAQWLKCKIMISKIVNKLDKNSLIFKIGTDLLNNIETRTAKLLTNKSLNACLYLDPRFSHTLSVEKKDEAVIFLKRLYDRLKALDSALLKDKENSATNCIKMEDPLECADEKVTHDDEDEYLNEYLSHHFEAQTHDNMNVYTKIENLKLPFQRVDINVLDFWKERQFADPELHALAKICFAIPPSQVTIEPAFSSLKLILADQQNRVNHETLENILMVKLNPLFLDQAIDDMPLFESDEFK
ncbi:uncharacterized protein LOC119681494 [Teleopsis dalmanni]|uniref:uncharacterized protein LOC119681494 n=1 Tax=Teleopsis dalmanni TaxID=139649 RepID=UPI0018CE58B8|nr:uncharacterized protein LOC119681494 [Teleopsis dalmanni]